MGSKWSEGLLVLDNWTFFLPQRRTPLAVACTHALSTSSEHDLVSALAALHSSSWLLTLGLPLDSTRISRLRRPPDHLYALAEQLPVLREPARPRRGHERQQVGMPDVSVRVPARETS